MFIGSRGDIRHEFVLWWISLFLLWNVFAVLASSAQVDSQSISSNISINLTNDTDSKIEVQSIFTQLADFHVNNFWVDLIFIITGTYAVYVLATLFFAIGG